MKVVTVAEMRALDRAASAERGIPEALLMENAGLAACEVLRRELAGVAGRRIAVLCGPGNNGGDGLVVARKLASWDAAVSALVFADPGRYGAAAAVNFEACRRSPGMLTVGPGIAAVRRALAGAEAVVDGLLGTGLARRAAGPVAQAIAATNAAGRPVLALDIPSGVAGDTGQLLGAAVCADWTVAFGLPKRGNLLYPGAARGGRLFVTHLSVPPDLSAAPHVRVAVNAPPPLPPRRPDGHKGSFGDALFVAGAAGYYGAPAFAALAHLKAGGGYARLAAPRSVCAVVGAGGTELVLAPQPETAAGSLGIESAGALLGLAERVDFVVLGPGLSLAPEARDLARRLAAAVTRPLLIDGDGLTALAGEGHLLAHREAPTVLTPHVGEAARLLAAPAEQVAADPIPAAQRLAAELRAMVVLKGAHSLIARPDGRVAINLTGSSGMASAGSGDVLTGTISAMHGLGLPVAEAVEAGVLVHGLAGDLAAAEHGEDGMTARDLLAALPAALRAYRERHGELTAGAGRLTVL